MFGVLNSFGKEMVVVERERASKSYSLSAYYLGKMMAEIPFNLLGVLSRLSQDPSGGRLRRNLGKEAQGWRARRASDFLNQNAPRWVRAAHLRVGRVLPCRAQPGTRGLPLLPGHPRASGLLRGRARPGRHLRLPQLDSLVVARLEVQAIQTVEKAIELEQLEVAEVQGVLSVLFA